MRHRRMRLGAATLAAGVAVGLVLAAAPATRAVAQGEPGPRAKVGAYYFDGWSGQTHHVTERLTTEFAAREPVWGWLDNTAEVMARQIDLAADGDLAFFGFCWYWPEGAEKSTPLNNALGLYLEAPNRDRLEFCLLVANHAGYRIGPKDWEEVSRIWIELFQKPTHLKVGGEPLLIFFSPNELIQAFGSPAEVKVALARLRAEAKAAGLAGVKVAACATPGPEHGWNDLNELAEAGFDLLTGYNYPGAGRRGPEPRRPFAELTEGSEGIYEAFAQKSPRPYVPVVTAGWDMRPWEARDIDPQKQAPYYPDRSPEAVADALDRAIRWLDQNASRTVPERLVLIYAWNENGEGGYLTPTRADGSAYLDAVRATIRREPEDESEVKPPG